VIQHREIREIERRSLTDYATTFGFPLEEFIRRRVTVTNRGTQVLNNHWENLGESVPECLRWYEKPTVDCILDTDRKISEGTCRDVTLGVYGLIRCHGASFSVDWDSLRRTAETYGVNAQADKHWVLNTLRNIPFIELYHPDVDAYVQSFRDNTACVCVNHSLGQIIQNILIKAVTNCLFPLSALGENPRPPFIMGFTEKEPFTPRMCARVILLGAKTYLGDIKAVNEIDVRVMVVSPAQAVFGIFMDEFAKNFALYHEYAHIVLGHLGRVTTNQDELQADCFATNCLAFQLRNAVTGDEELQVLAQLVTLCMYAPVLLMDLLGVMQLLRGGKFSESHPHPLARKQFIRGVVAKILPSDRGFASFRRELEILSDSLFEYVYNFLNVSLVPETKTGATIDAKAMYVPWDQIDIGNKDLDVLRTRIIWLRSSNGGVIYLNTAAKRAIVPLFTTEGAASRAAVLIEGVFGIPVEIRRVDGISRSDFERILLDKELPEELDCEIVYEGSDKFRSLLANLMAQSPGS
jgi:hypothetical protein